MQCTFSVFKGPIYQRVLWVDSDVFAAFISRTRCYSWTFCMGNSLVVFAYVRGERNFSATTLIESLGSFFFCLFLLFGFFLLLLLFFFSIVVMYRRRIVGGCCFLGILLPWLVQRLGKYPRRARVPRRVYPGVDLEVSGRPSPSPPPFRLPRSTRYSSHEACDPLCTAAVFLTPVWPARTNTLDLQQKKQLYNYSEHRDRSTKKVTTCEKRIFYSLLFFNDRRSSCT